MGKYEILANLEKALNVNKIDSGCTEFKNLIIQENQNLLDEYIRLQELNKAVVIMSSRDNLVEDISKILFQNGAKKLLYVEGLPFDIDELNDNSEKILYEKSVDEDRERLFNIDHSILEANCGVANLGIVGVASSNKSPRLTSLIVDRCIILLKKEFIVRTLLDGVHVLKGEGEILPTNMLFIAGPSRTSDIELKVVFGVHGPMATHILLY